jgi:carboxyl-terminal processing protease
MLDYLLPEGEIFVSVSKDGTEKVETSDASCVEMPMAVLVNQNSYSAAEFFAAALREYDWATVVGQQTTGKGRSQITKRLSDGSALHISTKKYMTPSRVDLSEVGGITPDIEIEISDEDFTSLYYDQLSHEDDEQLQAAVNAVLAADH